MTRPHRRSTPSSRAARAALLLVAVTVAACASPSPRETTTTSPSSAPAAPGPAPNAWNTASAAATAAPEVSAPAPAASASAPAAPPAAPEPPPVPVEVKNIGMHVGGGKNDAPEKAPIKRSVDPHMDAFARCFARSEDPQKGGDFGIDLRIEKEGGKAKASHPRTSLKGDDFKACVVGVFEAIDFEKPTGGITTVSYSLRFTPKKGG